MDTKFLLLIFILSAPASAQTNLGDLAWGLKNTGASQQLGIDHYTSGIIAGVKGEDIHLPDPQISSPSTPARKVVVAVLDTGVDSTHPQLKNALVGPGYNAMTGTTDASDGNGHGTHVSGIIAARLDASGFQGVSQNAMILPIKVISNGPNAPIRPQDIDPGPGTALTETVAKGLNYAIQNGAEVINLSMAWPSSIHSKRVDAAMQLAKQKNIIIVSSAGNDGTTADVYPCIYDNVICVGAHGPDGSFAYFSNYGSMVDLNAPGIAILSSWPFSKLPVTFAGQVGYEFRNGTSMSSPFVAGAIAELLSRGYSPDEAKNRILLGARDTQLNSLFSSPVQSVYSVDSSTEIKNTRFGNLDLTRALAVVPSPFILPTKKGITEVQWDGITSSITLPISFSNRWVASGATTITINDQTFHFDSIASGDAVTVPFVLNLGSNPNSLIHLNASVQTEGYQKNNIEITVSLVRILTRTQLPGEALVQSLSVFDPTLYTGIRSVVNADSNSRQDLLFTQMGAQGLQTSLVKGTQFVGSNVFSKFNEGQLLNLYRLPDSSYAAIFTLQIKGTPGPNFYIEKFDPNFNFISEIMLGTDVTVLSENFKWVNFKDTYTPLWIAIGYTPLLDQPKYDPWNPKHQDSKIQRIFYLDGSNLRTVLLSKLQTPLQILPDGRVLVADGDTYFQNYEILTLKDGKIIDQTPFHGSNYRMLIGLNPGITMLNLDGTLSNTVLLSGSSSPGSLRVTAIGANAFDQVLARATQLDALVNVIGSYSDQNSQYTLVQTQYALQLFTSNSNSTFSTTANRYSYIPSMIYSRSLFQTVIQDQNRQGLPAVYLPASVANANTSEVVYADLDRHALVRPASLRFRVTDPNCQALGNLIQKNVDNPASEVFVCGNQLIQIPLTIRR